MFFCIFVKTKNFGTVIDNNIITNFNKFNKNMSLKHFNWFVFDHINKYGIYFRDTIKGDLAVFWWNPLKIIRAFFRGTLSLGFFPLSTKHIKVKF